MRVALHNVKTLHKKIDLRKQQRLEDALTSASDALQGKFSRYRDRIDGGRLLHWQAIEHAHQMGHPFAALPIKELAALSAEELTAAGIAPDLIERAVIEFESAATIYEEYVRQSAVLADSRHLVARLREYTEGVRG